MSDHKKLLQNTDPVFVLFLGTAPAVMSSVSLKAALGMSLAAIFVMVCSAVIMALLKNCIGEGARLPATVLVTTFFAAAAQMLLAAFLPAGFAMLGIYVAMLAVNLMVFSVSDNEKSVGEAAKSAVLTGLYFAVAVLVLAGVRTLLGGLLGSFKLELMGSVYGGLILFAIELAVINALRPKAKKEEE